MKIHLPLIFQVLIIGSLAKIQWSSNLSNYTMGQGSGMTFYYRFSDDNKTISMGLEANQIVGYYAIGFAPKGANQMQQMDTVIFVVNYDQTSGLYGITYDDYWSTSKGTPKKDVDIGGTSDYKVTNFFVGEGLTQVQFERAMDTGDQYDYKFDRDTVGNDGLSVSWAYLPAQPSDNKLAYHKTNMGVQTEVKLANDKNGGGGNAPDTGINWYNVHKLGMLIAWGLVIEVALEFGRYQKHHSYSLDMHRILAFLVYAFSSFSIFDMLNRNGIQTNTPAKAAHLVVGLIIFSISTLQVAGGMLFAFKILKGRENKSIALLQKVHLYTGIFLYFTTKINLFIGLYMSTWDIYGGWLIALTVVALSARTMQEFYKKVHNMIKKRQHEKLDLKDSSQENHKALLELLNSNTCPYEIAKDHRLVKMKWAVLDDKVFEIKDFVHPGGMFVLDNINGREIGRFIYGAYGIETPGSSAVVHSHSANALKVMARNFIGTIQNGHHVFIQEFDVQKKSRSPSKLQLPEISGERNYPTTEIAQPLLTAKTVAPNCTLAKTTPINDYITKFEFFCRGFSVATETTDIRNLGRHMKISHPAHPKIRLYTLVMSQTEQRIQRRAQLLARSTVKGESSPLRVTPAEGSSETIPLIIKRYDYPNTFSGFIHGTPVTTDGFIIEGPFGPGFGLTSETAGLHYIFAGGTGLFPFLDLFDYLLEGVLDSSKTNLFAQGFQLHVFLSLNQVNDFVGADICFNLVQALESKGVKGAFSVTLKVKGLASYSGFEITNEKFDFSFVKLKVQPYCSKVFICGPPGMNESIPVALKGIGIADEKIILV